MPKYLTDLSSPGQALGEVALLRDGGCLPISIVRPSIVTAAWREPLPGWVENLNGPTGSIAAVGKGVQRSVYCRSVFALIPPTTTSHPPIPEL